MSDEPRVTDDSEAATRATSLLRERYARVFPWMALANAGALALCAGGYLAARAGLLYVGLACLGVMLIGHMIPATLVFGWSANFHLFVFLFLAFALLAPDVSLVAKIAVAIAVTAIYVTIGVLLGDHAPVVGAATVTLFKVVNMIMFAATLGYLSVVYSRELWWATARLHVVNEQLERLATTDALTGLLNRRSISEILDRERARFARTDKPFSVILGDIDDFKGVNDQHGHDVGDAALTAAATALADAVRTMDTVARWGGEEFLVLLPEADDDVAKTVATRIQERLRDVGVPSAQGVIRIRMTLGVATAVANQSINELLVRADRALYDGKRAGKDRVVMAAS